MSFLALETAEYEVMGFSKLRMMKNSDHSPYKKKSDFIMDFMKKEGDQITKQLSLWENGNFFQILQSASRS